MMFLFNGVGEILCVKGKILVAVEKERGDPGTLNTITLHSVNAYSSTVAPSFFTNTMCPQFRRMQHFCQSGYRGKHDSASEYYMRVCVGTFVQEYKQVLDLMQSNILDTDIAAHLRKMNGIQQMGKGVNIDVYIRASVDALHRDGTSEISFDPRTKCLKTR